MARQRSMEAILASEYVTIGELVRLTETRYSTLKFYTEEGFLQTGGTEADTPVSKGRSGTACCIHQKNARRRKNNSGNQRDIMWLMFTAI